MFQEAKSFILTRRRTNLAIAVINIAVFIVLSLLGNTTNTRFMLEHGAAYTPFILDGEYYRLFTSMWLHFGITHLVYNMVCLIAMGDLLERATGAARYLLIYLTGGIAGNLVSMGWDCFTKKYAVSAGASGAISAVIGAYLAIMLRHRDRIGERRLKRLAAMAVLMIAEGFTQAGTDNAAHIGGMLAGFILGAVLSLFSQN